MAFEMPLGSIIGIFGSSKPPSSDWLLCDGSTLTTTQAEDYSGLASLLTNNTLPDLRGLALIGAGVSAPIIPPATTPLPPVTYAASTVYGSRDHTLSQDQMPSHQHYGWGESSNVANGLVNNAGMNGNCGFGTSSRNVFYGSASSDMNNYLYGSSFAGGQGQYPGPGDTEAIDVTYDQPKNPYNYNKVTTYGHLTPNNPFSLIQPSFAIHFFIYAVGGV